MGNGSFGSISNFGWQLNGNNLYNTNSGFVGISTNVPQSPLDVNGNAIIRGTLHVYNGIVIGRKYTGEKVDVDTLKSQRVETTKIEAVEINASDKAKIQTITIDGINSKISSTTGIIDFENTNLKTQGQVNANTISADILNVDNAIFDNLDVNGDIHANGKISASAFTSNSPFIIEAPIGTPRIYIDDITGNVGINTVSPSSTSKLHIELNSHTVNGQTSNGLFIDVPTLDYKGWTSAFRAKGGVNNPSSIIGSYDAKIGEIASWDAYGKVIGGVSGYVKPVFVFGSGQAAIATGTSSIADLNDLVMESNINHPNSAAWVGGMYAEIKGTVSNYADVNSRHAISAVIGIDNINGSEGNGNCTYAGYFDGKTHFTDNVGIGIKDPTEKLEVKGSIVAMLNPDKYLKIDAPSVGGVAAIKLMNSGILHTPLIFTPNGGIKIVNDLYDGFNASGTDGQYLSATGSGNVEWRSWPEEVDNLGNHIADENIQLGDFWLSNDGDVEGIHISSDGNVGIGLNTPQTALLDIVSSGAPTLNLRTTATGGPVTATMNFVGSQQHGVLGEINFINSLSQSQETAAFIKAIAYSDPETARIIIGTNNGGVAQSALAVSGNGNVGIGTVTPDSKMQITQLADGAGLKVLNTYNNPYNYNIISAVTNEYTKAFVVSLNGTDNFRIYGNGETRLANTLYAEEIIVQTPVWSDFVFDKEYDLRSLTELENYIYENNHLPNIPSEQEVIENGINLGEMDSILLQKIEELTLYIIEQDKRIKELEENNN